MEYISLMQGFYQNIDANSFIRRTKMSEIGFTNFLDNMSQYELDCFGEIINRMNILSKIEIGDILLSKTDWRGRTFIRISIRYPMGEIKWSFLGNFEIFDLIRLYTFGLVKINFTFDELLTYLQNK